MVLVLVVEVVGLVTLPLAAPPRLEAGLLAKLVGRVILPAVVDIRKLVGVPEVMWPGLLQYHSRTFQEHCRRLAVFPVYPLHHPN